jgi:hypothetical protein
MSALCLDIVVGSGYLSEVTTDQFAFTERRILLVFYKPQGQRHSTYADGETR